MAQGLGRKRTWDEGAWTFCARCGDRQPIKDMTWQRAKLLCNRKCLDSFPLLGQIDKGVAVALSNIVFSPDLQPDPKLTHPTLDGVESGDIFI